ncbi:hypothetical protein M2164_005994 [Streptomyces sp. SAI-208]|uniref:hypothetical protein n=1 Tax=Streptomyces sp. SAI-208 TaxID=2940550 RepID=UPI0024733AEA|nr:hypothetical protein [Streptomyces sp. SAI-208]MDH6610359.1 hypothetical protein [Streptomyces sp. SAI-208]
MPHTFEDLIVLERAAQAAHQQYTAPGIDDLDAARRAWIKAAAKFQAAVTEHAAADDKQSRYEVEMAIKKAVRHGGAG